MASRKKTANPSQIGFAIADPAPSLAPFIEVPTSFDVETLDDYHEGAERLAAADPPTPKLTVLVELGERGYDIHRFRDGGTTSVCFLGWTRTELQELSRRIVAVLEE